MDLKINGIGFQGKKEVLYGLTKAAQNAREYEYTKCYSRMNGLNKFNERIVHDASIKAYLDMATHDSSFLSTLSEATTADLYPIKQILKPGRTQHMLIEPFNKFSEELKNTLNSVYSNKISASTNNTITDFLSRVKSDKISIII